MSSGETAGPVHPELTRRSRYRYCFYVKHHGKSGDAGTWLPELSHEEEFRIFDDADFHIFRDDDGDLYGVRRRSTDGRIPALGTLREQVAEFPFARENQAWHGYPCWPLKHAGPPNRRGAATRPSKQVFQRMEAEGFLTSYEWRRLYKGRHA